MLYVAILVSLSACATGGGGGLPAQQPSNNPAPQPPPQAAPAPAPQPAYDPINNQLVPTGALAAQQAGYTGGGINVGVMDTGANPSVAGLQGRLTWFNSYLALGNKTLNQNNLSSANDPYGHGTGMADIIGGAQQGTAGSSNYFVGGVAPQSNLYIAQVCNASGECQIYSKAYQDLMANGVHLYNQSFGALSSDVAASEVGPEAKSIGETFAPLGTGNLYVWSAGDLFNGQPQSDINIEALVPEQVPSLQSQWLVATSVHLDANGNPDGLSSYAPDCGAAAQWCLAAPGAAEIATVPGTSFTGSEIGTSASAAVITGVAALVWQAFPWFTPANVTDTVLTTATPLGSGTYPNTTYGWGEVNAAKAINGPAQLAFGTFNANIGAYQSTFANPIGGSGGLALSGTTGTLTLAGADTYSGGTTVNSGNLWLSGSVASDVSINGGSFGGPGTVTGNVSNNGGTLISQSSIGGNGLTITGNYSANLTSTTGIGIGNPLTVDGSANLAGDLEILAPPMSYSPKSTETLIDAGILKGSFATQTYGAGVYYTVSHLLYGQHNLTGTVTRSNVQQTTAALPSVNAAELNVAGAIQKSLQKIDGWNMQQQTVNAGFLRNTALFLGAQTGQQAKMSLESLSGEIYGTMRELEVQQVLDTTQTIGERMDVLGGIRHPGVWIQGTGTLGTFRQPGTAT
ncbi:putative outer membrane autotransporter, partial [Acidithiobacillus sp. GGI-221]